MPQIWVTYSELGAHLGLSPDAARSHAIEAGLDRRRCSDHETRVKLPGDMALAYLGNAPDVIEAVYRRGAARALPLPNPLDEAELALTLAHNDPAHVSGPFTDALVAGLRSVLSHADARHSAAS